MAKPKTIYQMTVEERDTERSRALEQITRLLFGMTTAEILRIEKFVKGVYER